MSRKRSQHQAPRRQRGQSTPPWLCLLSHRQLFKQVQFRGGISASAVILDNTDHPNFWHNYAQNGETKTRAGD